jgi:rod shape-determining protein MreD
MEVAMKGTGAGCLALTVVALLGDPWIDVGPLGTGRPDACLLPFVVLILSSSGPFAVCGAALLGLVGDCLGSSPLGVQMGVYALIAAAIAELRPRRALSAVELIVLSGSSGFFAEFLCRPMRSLADNGVWPSATFARQAACGALTAAAIVAAVCLAGSVVMRLASEGLRPNGPFYRRRRQSLG